MNEDQGARLRAFLRARLGVTERKWVEPILEGTGLSPTTLYGWMSGQRTPDLDALGKLADYVAQASGEPCHRWELVAAMDADGPGSATFRETLRQAVKDLLDSEDLELVQKRPHE